MPGKALMVACASIFCGSAAFAEPPDFELFDHNGSQMTVEYKYNAIRYMFPKSSLNGIIDRGQVVFTGDIEYRGKADGRAYVYKRGCDWVEYPVSGHYDSSIPGFVLIGKAPIREKSGCKVIGYTMKSPNARLVFVDTAERDRREQNATISATYEDEGQQGWAEGFLDGDGKVGKVSK